jgi:hypothetical protein
MRSFIKAVSWRVTGSIDTFVISLLVTGKFGMAGTIERRWAARFCRPALPAAPQSQPQQQQQLSEPAKAKGKTRRVNPAGLRSVPAV